MKEQYNTYEIVHKFLYIFLGITTKNVQYVKMVNQNRLTYCKFFSEW